MEVVYPTPFKDCPMVYFGETCRRYGVWEKEHMKDAKHLEGVNYTRAKKRNRRQNITSLRDGVNEPIPCFLINVTSITKEVHLSFCEDNY